MAGNKVPTPKEIRVAKAAGPAQLEVIRRSDAPRPPLTQKPFADLAEQLKSKE